MENSFLSKGRVAVAACLLSFSSSLAAQQLKLPLLYSDNMILQASETTRVRGECLELAGKKMTIAFQSQGTAVTTQINVAASGEFVGELDLSSAVGQQGTLSYSTNGVVLQQIKNVLLGDVWLASGQSNMCWKVRQSDGGKEVAANAKYPEIRFFYVPRAAQAQRQQSYEYLQPLKPHWVVCSPESAGEFSAVAFHFAQSIQQHRKVPVGIIECAWGGSSIETWLSEKAIETLTWHAAEKLEWQKRYDLYEKQNKETLTAWEKARDKSQELPTNHRGQPFEMMEQHRPCWLYNAMAAPIGDYSLKGIIWYQGENNARDLETIPHYREAFKAWVAQWRKQSRQADLPVFWVNLAGFEPSAKHSKTWPAFREVQTQLLQDVSPSGQALAIDLGAKKNVHPKNKKDVGERLALAARAITYGEEVAYRGPELLEYTVVVTRVRLKFSQNFTLKGEPFFQLAGSDGKFHKATVISHEKDTIELEAVDVTKAKELRYNWRGMPQGHLYSAEGLPATPFRKQL